MQKTARRKGIVFIIISYIILSADEPVVAKLIQLGNNFTIHGRNPISFCNLLFIGSLMGALTLFFIQYKNFRTFNFMTLTRKDWAWLFTSAFFIGFLTPSLFFFGIMYANIINVILLSTLNAPITLFAAWLIFSEKPNMRLILASLITISGSFVIVLIQQWTATNEKPITQITSTGPLYDFLADTPNSGEICVFLGVVSSTISTLISFHAVTTLPGGIFNTFRMGLGAVFFFFIALALFGWGHFSDLLSPFLWKWMILYGPIIVGMGMFFNYLGLQHIKVADDVIASSLTPLFSIVFSYLILGEAPGVAQIIGGCIIFTGIVLAMREQIRHL
ncbi:TPA: DMT family transporter [Legionella pneumophila]|uniref:DMT family transporter n=1 Tax=Legionella pneumophila subsp. pneumophila TaxID=91891 RepID=A0A3A6UNJ7_LEGPN|nr:DMT family transporter [Legionella pneumophila]ERH44722.1 permease [Legionella pneumophila str. Leg01/53]ERH46191.1 permease [Legionella pneumophila str. Leg01/11]ERI47609.1 permease [Legionella pneumophila str. Leg01/20]ANN96600.1 permease [Legionella pneumophila]ERB40134.1 permease [Legionella pneumophila str. 121004]